MALISQEGSRDPPVTVDPSLGIEETVRLAQDTIVRFDVCEISSVKESICGMHGRDSACYRCVTYVRGGEEDSLKLPVSTETSLSEG